MYITEEAVTPPTPGSRDLKPIEWPYSDYRFRSDPATPAFPVLFIGTEYVAGYSHIILIILSYHFDYSAATNDAVSGCVCFYFIIPAAGGSHV